MRILLLSLLMGVNVMAETKIAYFAGGCFWCVEKDFEKLDGVGDVVSGYMGGHVIDPSYDQITTGKTGHREAVKVPYDPNKISYEKLVDYFLRHIDPTDDGGQFCDRGFQYSPAVYYDNDQELKIIESLFNKEYPFDIKVAIASTSTFYDAEDYHQNYYKENPLRYNYYRTACGRDRKIKKIWK